MADPRPQDVKGKVLSGFTHQTFNCNICGENYISIYESKLQKGFGGVEAAVAHCWCGAWAFVPLDKTSASNIVRQKSNG